MKIKKVLIANRGEIAIRIARACSELAIHTVSVYTYEDRYSLHRYKTDESYQIGEDNEPLKPYLDIQQIIEVAVRYGADAIHPGYGFLSENAGFAKACIDANIIFVGPQPAVMSALGDKIAAKLVAKKALVPQIESNENPLNTVEIAIKEAARIGFPLMMKAASGGGGRGMRIVRNANEIEKAYRESKSEAATAFGDDTVFIEKYVEAAKHLEVQIVADNYGNIVHLFERDCSVQRRFQKVVEIAPSIGLKPETRQKLYDAAIKITSAVQYNNVGTVEFLVDAKEDIYFIEVNPRIQVEHTVTEMVTGYDLIKTQLYIAAGYRLSDPEINLGNQSEIKTHGYAIQCRITTEDPINDFKPDYGTLITYRNAAGFGIRLDEGSSYPGMKISPFFDSLLVKVSSMAFTLEDAARKMSRALSEFRIRGVKNNIQFLENIMKHPTFSKGKATVDFIKNYPELFEFKTRFDRGTKTLKFIAEVSINGNPDIRHKQNNFTFAKAKVPFYDHAIAPKAGTKQKLEELGPERFAKWLRNEKAIFYTDTTFRDAHQSLLATRVRTSDMLKVAASFAAHHPQTFSLEMWGGATFDASLRFLHEDPWQRLALIRKAVPNILLQMLIRGTNGLGYTAYPENVIEKFVCVSAEKGIDIFRIFDSLNWMQSIAPCIGFVRKHTNSIAQGTLCYTGDILDVSKKKYTLEYYLQMAKDLENAGSHILGIKDMSGLLKPYAAQILVEALRDTVSIPLHLHTHDTSSLQTSTYLKAIEAEVDVIDVAIGSMSGLTSQPNFNAIVEMMRFQEREQPYDIVSLNQFSDYWETVRTWYYPFESGMKTSSAEVYQHEIPGGQYSNLLPQAISLGLGEKWDQIKRSYADVNDLFGDIVKVTPSSKVVGDMTLFMVSNNYTKEDILQKGKTISFPESVKGFFMGEMGQPVGGFPVEMQKIILKDAKPFTDHPNKHLKPVDLEKGFTDFKKTFLEDYQFTDYLSWLLFPKVFEEYHLHQQLYGDVANLPTKVFFYGMDLNEETIVEISKGKTILVELLSIGEADDKGMITVFFKLNGQTRNIELTDKSVKVTRLENAKADKSNATHIGAPLQGLLSSIFVKEGDVVEINQPLFMIEAMKMETTTTATAKGKISKINLTKGSLVNTDDLILEVS